jgi:FKBP-type peptidyl-prolyl cis-trans isomerase FkpA
MVKYLLSSVVILLFASSCLKNSNDDPGCPYTERNIYAPASEVQALQTYLDTNGITAVKDTFGYFYQIVNPGTGTDSAGLCSLIRIKYRGVFTNGQEFDKKTDPVDFPLGDLIEGWRKGLTKIRRGGQIKLYIPPSLGYGSQDYVNPTTGQILIPKNSILVFDVTLIDYTSSN